MPDASIVYADRSTRLGAAILDSIIMMGMVYVPLLGGMMLGGVTGASPGDPMFENGMPAAFFIGLILTVVGFIAWCWLTIKYVRENGQSIAKKILKIKVVRADGSPASLGRIFWLRNFVNGLLGIIPFYGVVELLFIFGEAQQCLHDKLADTIVVKE